MPGTSGSRAPGSNEYSLTVVMLLGSGFSACAEPLPEPDPPACCLIDPMSILLDPSVGPLSVFLAFQR